MVVIGGGSGLSVLLRGLKRAIGAPPGPGLPGLGRLTGVVTVTDDGGSSGRLRRDFGVLPPGDIRNCIAALADDTDLLTRLFQYRFPNGGGLAGHSFGNLFLTALTGITGDFYQAILTAEQVLSVRGRIYPATLTDVRLEGVGRSGKVYRGESAIGHSGEPLERVTIEPANPPAFGPAVEAIEQADLILLGPGSLYTSILPNLLIASIRRAVAESPAPVVLLLNLMTQPGETDGMDGLAHLHALRQQTQDPLVDAVLVNSTPPSRELVQRYADLGAEPVAIDRAGFEAAGVRVIETDLLAEGDLVRHDPEKLGRAVLGLLGRGEVRLAG
ncbi:MAG TPA: uridine diphosphate-N-acetylglucosamine-binding protein YvcK [Thermoanaerobaculia bacterium]|nr:uridine diphosphate-N-acetylglucosamine-binding protein YvcK [Thermoanaerobaculia bacterium]